MLVIVIIIAAVFLVLDQAHAPMNSSSTATSTVQGQTAGSTDGASSTLTAATIDTSSWEEYSNAQPAFRIEYPADLVLSTSTIPTIDGPYLLELQFPKDIYFSTVLKDEAYVIVTASSTCPVVSNSPIDRGPQTINVNGMSFTENEAGDVGAGNIYHTITYDTVAKGLCYRITLFDHGANGAGLYLSDPVAIQAADVTHDAELSKIEAVVLAMIDNFSTAASK